MRHRSPFLYQEHREIKAVSSGWQLQWMMPTVTSLQSAQPGGIVSLEDVKFAAMPPSVHFHGRLTSLEQSLNRTQQDVKSSRAVLDSMSRTVAGLEAKSKINGQKRFYKEYSFWFQCLAAVISMASLALNWHSQRQYSDQTTRKLGHFENVVNGFAGVQAREVVDQVAAASESKTPLPKPQLMRAQSSAQLLVRNFPEQATTWDTVAAVVNYRTDGFNEVVPRPECNAANSVQDGANVPLTVLPYLRSIQGLTQIESACAIDLDVVRLPVDVKAVFYLNADIYYSGGSLPNVTLVFFACRFHMKPARIPAPRGQKLMQNLLTADLANYITSAPLGL